MNAVSRMLSRVQMIEGAQWCMSHNETIVTQYGTSVPPVSKYASRHTKISARVTKVYRVLHSTPDDFRV